MTRAGAHTLGTWLPQRAELTPDRVAIDVLDEPTTYRQLDQRAGRLASALAEMGLARGDRVATLTANSAEHVELFWACARAGLVLVPLNWRLAADELAYQVSDAEPVLLFAQDQHVGLAEDALARAHTTTKRLELSRSALDDLTSGSIVAPPADLHDDDAVLIVYTSGTTGRPKGAVLTHANCFWTNLSLDRTADLSSDDIALQVLPQFHVGGWNVQPLLAWWKGATVVIEPSFDPGRALELVARKRVTTLLGVPATYLFMAEHDDFATTDLSSLRLAIVGGAPMPEALLARWHDRGVALAQGYGLTEAAPNVLCLPPEDAARKLGYAGKPYLHVEVALRNPETGAHLDGAARGELVVRGPNVFAGYWRDDAATRAAFADGWLLTGDIAERDPEGYFRICDRVKDMYISGGENVYPAEVEAVLHEHPAVIEAAVIGVPDERWGEVGLAVVGLRDPSVSADELIAHCREHLARYKVPRHVRVVDALPRSAVNKVLKPELRARFIAPSGEVSTAPGRELMTS